MGCNFCKKKGYQTINYLAPLEKEIEIKDFSSQNDDLLEILETKYNLFKYIQIVEYINLLEEFTIETCTVITDEPLRTNFKNGDEFLGQCLTLEEFQSFIENKIFYLEDLNEIIGNNQEEASFFKKACLEIYKALDLKLKQKLKNDNNIINKRTLLAIGILFCSSENIEKIKLIFNIFQNNEEILQQSDDFDNFLLTLFLISSYCLISTRNHISNEKLGIEKISKEDFVKLENTSELKDCENLLKLFNDNFFKGSGYTWQQFRNKFEDKENGFGWVISSKGIRRKLEENNK